MNRVAAVLVTRNSMPRLDETLSSIDGQSRAADALIAIDDHSSDGTVFRLREAGFDVDTSTSTANDVSTRIAQNFVQGLRSAQFHDADLVVLGDHDDVWHPQRIEHQVGVLERSPEVAMVASDGFLIDSGGVALPGTIRSSFPVPDGFSQWSPRQQMRYAIRHSVATGGASALRLAQLDDWSVPLGWLHDRWWSLVALRQGKFLADPSAVIDYRLSDDQQVGLHTSGQDRRAVWWLSKMRRAGHIRDLARLVHP